MVSVKRRGDETVDSMVRRFKRAVQKSGLTDDLRRVAHYSKPSEIRREKKRRAVSRSLREARDGQSSR